MLTTNKRIFLPNNIDIKNIINLKRNGVPQVFKSDFKDYRKYVNSRLYVCSMWPQALSQAEITRQLKDPTLTPREKKDLVDSLTKEELLRDWDKLIGLPFIDGHMNDEENFTFSTNTRDAFGMVIGVSEKLKHIH